jgi:predicted transcriptional regulator
MADIKEGLADIAAGRIHDQSDVARQRDGESTA